MSAEASSSSSAPNGHQSQSKPTSSIQASQDASASRVAHDDELSEPDEVVEVIENPDDQLKRVAAAKRRHEADLLEHHYEAPKADRLQDDWQVAFVWAFIMKFHQRDRIRNLNCLEDFESCLLEPVACRPDDVLEGIFIRFLSNLKPGLRNLNCTNIQSHLSNYISDMLLNSNDFTVWDRPWAPNEEARAGCCNHSTGHLELGRLRYVGEPLAERVKQNPIKKIEEQGGGLFELDWRERAKLLRQLINWQLNSSEPIRAIINRVNKVNDAKTKKAGQDVVDADILTEPLGLDRDKNRIWSFDDSGRLYKSGNPFKRPCPLFAITSSRVEFDQFLDKTSMHGSQNIPKLKGSGAKSKATLSEATAHRKLLKGIEDEKLLAERLEGMVPAVEKEEARIHRLRRKVIAAYDLAQLAELRTTRTRRATKKIDYTYEDDSEIDEAPTRRSRHEMSDDDEQPSTTVRGKPFIPGERKSTRNARDRAQTMELDQVDDETVFSNSGRSDGPGTARTSISNESGNGRQKGMKGYAYVPDDRAFEQLTPKEQKTKLEHGQAILMNGAALPTNGFGEHGTSGMIGRTDADRNGSKERASRSDRTETISEVG